MGSATPSDPPGHSVGRASSASEADIRSYETFQDVVARLPRFLEEVYNARRPHSALGYVSPAWFEEINTREAA